MLLGIGLGYFFGEMLISLGLFLEKGGRVAAFKYGEVVLSYIADVTIFGTAVYATDLSGAIIILGSFTTITILKAKGIVS